MEGGGTKKMTTYQNVTDEMSDRHLTLCTNVERDYVKVSKRKTITIWNDYERELMTAERTMEEK